MSARTLDGFILITPEGLIDTGTFEVTRGASIGHATCRKVEGRYQTWATLQRLGWRIKSARILIDELTTDNIPALLLPQKEI